MWMRGVRVGGVKKGMNVLVDRDYTNVAVVDGVFETWSALCAKGYKRIRGMP